MLVTIKTLTYFNKKTTFYEVAFYLTEFNVLFTQFLKRLL